MLGAGEYAADSDPQTLDEAVYFVKLCHQQTSQAASWKPKRDVYHSSEASPLSDPKVSVDSSTCSFDQDSFNESMDKLDTLFKKINYLNNLKQGDTLSIKTTVVEGPGLSHDESGNTGESVLDSSEEFGNNFQTVVVKGGVPKSSHDESGNTESVPDSASDEFGNTDGCVPDSASDEFGNIFQTAVVKGGVPKSSHDESGNTGSVPDSASDEFGNTDGCVPDSASDEFGNIFQTAVVEGGVPQFSCDESGNTEKSVPDSLSNLDSSGDESGNTSESVPDPLTDPDSSSDESGNIDVSGNTDESVPDSQIPDSSSDESGNTVVNEGVIDSSSDESGNTVVNESVTDSSSDESGNTVITESVVDSSSDESGNMCRTTAVGGGAVKSERRLRRERRWGVREASTECDYEAGLQPQISAHPWVLPPWPPPP